MGKKPSKKRLGEEGKTVIGFKRYWQVTTGDRKGEILILLEDIIRKLKERDKRLKKFYAKPRK